MLKKIRVEQVRMGMHIHELCGSWMEHPFWRTKFTLTDPEDLRLLQDSGISEVWIDAAKGLDLIGGETRDQVESKIEQELLKVAQPDEQPKHASMREEVERAAMICSTSKKAVTLMFQEVRMGRAIDAEAAGALVEEISSSVLRNPGALISLARLKTADDYTYMHSVAVCGLMVALARQLNLDAKLTRELGLAGLLHDMGKAFMPQEVLNKPGKLTDEEFFIMRQHPSQGHKALLEGGAVGEIPLEVCLHHHEKTDGSGYPDKLTGNTISLYAKMGAVCDVYDAITSNRSYKVGWDPAESIRKMTEWCKGHFDEHVFMAFVKSVGIYPIGSLIRLKSSRLGVVVEQSENSLVAPRIKVIFSTKSNTYLKPEFIDLSRPHCPEKIIGREDPAQWGIRNLELFWGLQS